MKKLIFCFCSFAFLNQACVQQPDSENHIVFQNENCSLTIDLFGGAIDDFRLNDIDINPFTWELLSCEMPENNRKGAPFKGHFLCLGRWGEPTKGEIKSGVPHNGQSSNEKWKIVSFEKKQKAELQSVAPLDYTTLKRSIILDEKQAVFKITDQITSHATVGRLFNVVQHVTVGPPFLSESTTIDCNAGKGFMQHLCYPDPERYAYEWPAAIVDSTGLNMDLTKSDEAFSYVSTHLMKDSTGWVTASSPESGLMLGYIWKTAEYPWINIWHQRQDGQLRAKGLEFGTTGVGKSYQELLAVDTRFRGINSYIYLDAKEEINKSFICFLLKIPANFAGVESISLGNGEITIVEKQGKNIHTIPCSFRLYPPTP